MTNLNIPDDATETASSDCDFRFHARYPLAEHPEYNACIDEYRNGDLQAMLLGLEITGDLSEPAMLRLFTEWNALRQCTDAPLFVVEPTDGGDAWVQFVSMLGFRFTEHRLSRPDGSSSRLFVSVKARS